MEASIVTLRVKLEATTKQDGERWIARCVALDVASQGDSKQAAISSLEEAVQLWFESCLERDVLSEALAEVGFTKAKPGEPVPEEACVAEMDVSSQRITRKRKSPAAQYIEVSVPAYIAASHLGISAAS